MPTEKQQQQHNHMTDDDGNGVDAREQQQQQQQQRIEEENQTNKRFVFPWDQHNSHESIVIPEEDKIQYPRFLLWYHITSKGFQIGSVAGMGAGIPLFLLDRYTGGQQQAITMNYYNNSNSSNRTVLAKQMWRTMVTSSVQASLLGLVAFGSIATYFTRYHYNQKELDDIAFRVYHNHMMKEWETIGWTGTIAGALVGVLRKSNANSSAGYSRFYSIVRSGVVGSCVGMTVFGALQAKKFLMD